jgi:aryl-alcohol dehydrogenase-like predicted oxidoreductase
MNRRDFLKSLMAVTAVGVPAAGTAAEHGAASLLVGKLALPQRPLGKTGVTVSVLGLGGVIGMQRPPSPDHDPVAIAEAALDLGITYFDTAPAYNNGQSETNYGRVLARRRKEVFVAAKTGDRTREGALRSIEQSLKRLQTDHVDLIQIHGVSATDKPADWAKPEGVLAALRRLRDEKVTRFIGLTGHESADKLRQALEMHEFDTLLTTLNPVSRRRAFREELLPAANQKRLGVIAMKVMGGGNGCLVTGNPLNKLLQPYHDATFHQVEAKSLICYTLGLPVSVAVVGVASVEQLKANVGIVKGAIPMAAAERLELEQLMG